MTEYKPNSYKSKEEAAEEKTQEKRVEKVVSGTVKTRDNKGRKFADVFISEDAANVKSYILMDVLVPAFKKLVSDIVTDGIDMILYGGNGRSKSRSGNTVSYRSYYDKGRSSSRSEEDRFAPRATAGRFSYEDIVFGSRVDAEAVRNMMADTIERYGFVTVADMYDMAELTAPYTSNNYGWTSIRTAEVVHVRDGYILKLPKAMPIE